MEIRLKRGATLNLPMQVLLNGQPLSLSGKALVYVVKERPSDPDDAAVLTFTLGSGLSLVSASTGDFKLTASAEGMDLPPGYYHGALQIRDSVTGEIVRLPEDAIADTWLIVGHGILSTTLV